MSEPLSDVARKLKELLDAVINAETPNERLMAEGKLAEAIRANYTKGQTR